MARHYRKKAKNRLRPGLLFLLIIALIAVFAVSKHMPTSTLGEYSIVSHDVSVTTETCPKSSDIAVEHGETNISDEDSHMSVDMKKEIKYTDTDLPDVPYAPSSAERPLLAIIIDDGGNQLNLTKGVAGLGLPLTWAILPYTRYAAETARIADSKQIPYMLHLPMQAMSDQDGSKEYIVGRGMSDEQIRAVTAEALDLLPNAIGLNNHRGSLATSSSEIIEPVMEVLKERSLIFIDSRTSGKSVAHDVALTNGVPTMKNNGFLDGSPEKKEIEKRFDEVIKFAARRGSAIAICHFRPTTVSFLEQLTLRKDTLPLRLVTIPEMLSLLKIEAH